MSEIENLETFENERSLVEEMRKLPDFESFVFPSSWYKKYNIPLATAVNPREFMKSNYAMTCAVEPKDLPPIIRNEPLKDTSGKVRFVEVPEIKPGEYENVSVVSRPLPPEEIVDGRLPDVHPSLRTEEPTAHTSS
jgi:hypothetical protein